MPAMETPFWKRFEGGVQLSSAIYCVWCKSPNLTQLCQLGCFHLSCKPCLERKLEDPRPGTIFNCPECDMSCIVPLEGVKGFQDEPLQHKMEDVLTLFSDRIHCTVCETIGKQTASKSICLTCGIHLCFDDTKCHQESNGHRVETFESLYHEPLRSLMLMNSDIGICNLHAKEKKGFCKKCEENFCTECLFSKHSDHPKNSVSNVALEYRHLLEGKLSGTQKAKSAFEENLGTLLKKQAHIQEKSRKTVEELQMKPAGKETVRVNFQRIDSATKQERFELKFKIEEETNKIKQCDTAEKYITVFLKYCSEVDLLVKFKAFSSILEKSLCMVPEEPLESLYMDMTLNKRMGQRHAPHTPKNTKTKDDGGSKLNGCHLVARWETGCVWCGVAGYGAEILVTAEQKVDVYGLQGDKRDPVKNKLKNASDIEVLNSEIYVSDSKKREVLVIDKTGKVKRKLTLPSKEKSLDGPLGLSVDKITETLYISSASTNTIYKCPKGGTAPQEFVTNAMDYPSYLCVTHDNGVVVSNHHSHSVCKFNDQGKLMWRYGGEKGAGDEEMNAPRGICTDHLGQIYVADWANNRIHLLSEKGRFLSYIDIGEDIEVPRTLTFIDEKLVVTLGDTVIVVKCDFDKIK